MRRIICVLLVYLLPQLCFGQADSLTISIDLNDRKQQIHAFGASDAWSTQFVGENWPLAKRQQIAELLFSTEMDSAGNPLGIGLSLWRFNIGAGSARQGNESKIEDPWRRAESFLTADSTYDWNKQKGQQWFMKAAQEHGVDQFVGFVNSPPILLTKNGKAFGDGSGQANISSDNYDKFANYLSTIAEHFEEKGIPFQYISPVNEPQWDWSENNGQEGSPYQNSEIAGVVKALDEALKAYNLDAKIEIPETAQINYLYKGDLPGRSNQVEYFFGKESEVAQLSTVADKMAAHSYFTTWPVENMIEQRKKLKKIFDNHPELEYWMSEYCILADNKEIKGSGRDLGIDPALYVARLIHFDLTLANASSWQWWLAVSPYDYKDGLVYIDKNKEDGHVYESKLLWGLGNFSRFIRPGAYRLGVERSDNALHQDASQGLMVSSYLEKDSHSLTIVLVNYGKNGKTLNVNLKNTGTAKNIKFTPYITSREFDLNRMNQIVNGAAISIPGRSIVTLQGKL